MKLILAHRILNIWGCPNIPKGSDLPYFTLPNIRYDSQHQPSPTFAFDTPYLLFMGPYIPKLYKEKKKKTFHCNHLSTVLVFNCCHPAILKCLGQKGPTNDRGVFKFDC